MAGFKNATEVPNRTSGRRGSSFPTSDGHSGVSVSPGKGGVNIGTPMGCESKRAASNVKQVYGHGRY